MLENSNSPVDAPILTSTNRLVARAQILGRFVSFQILAQAVGVLSGILLVRALSRREYAFFTIANTMQGTMNLLADTGLSIGLTSIGGKVWHDRYRFGQLIATTLRLRRRLALVAIGIVTPILLWLLVTNGSKYLNAAVITLIVLAGLNYQLTISVFGVVPRMLSQISRLQRLDLASAVVRLVLLTAAYLFFLNAITAILASVVTLGLQYILLKRWASDGIDRSAPLNEDDRRELNRIVKIGIPTTVFYCFQGQVTVWLMSSLGNASSVADLGALGRLGVIFSVIVPVMTTIVVPRFARYHEPRMLRRRFIQIMTCFVAFTLVIVAASAMFPVQILWVLGKKYSLLGHELLLMMILTGVNATAEAMWLLNSAKAWIEHSWLHIPCTLVTQAFLLTIMKVSTLRGALLFGIFSLVPSILLNIWLAARGLRRTVASAVVDSPAANP
jgi:O-antigen/teichoic acid export membrane protein